MSASPPPTPPSGPVLDEEWRFKTMTSPCEWIEDYRPGGYHPVLLGDLFNDGQYKVIRKLGEGSFSTVWLARDERQVKSYVALKILVAEASGQASEVRILQHLAAVAPAEEQRYITQLLDEFEHRGPNGTHKCLVFEPMGPTVNSMSLQVLAFLHSNGIAHGDFQPGNMLFALQDLESATEDRLRQEEDVQKGSISPLVERLDGKRDLWAPRYLCISQPLSEFTCYEGDFKIKLADMGGAFFLNELPSKAIIPLGLRSPELILTGDVDQYVDMWSFGCLVFELVTGRPLFCVPGSDFEDDDHLLSLTARLGALPSRLFKLWKTSSLYFGSDGKLFNNQIGGVSENREPRVVPQQSMEELFDKAEPNIDEKEGYQVKKLIRRILDYDAVKRPSAAELLLDPWFCAIEM
ncbi:serine protein kinase [Beauveria bassiana ARSEF 2860]|uniref:non-specific serine/threonine protein kinase n=1 Tax=Beauveria bassiana (strain ARSEF 2860) TaxID=655819 RepID=J5JLK8_BEAB2|nr:serine protein kinase [Beauveria bassiana ARSEF 2860]EJP66228.1 serine protein kinase [Beauveria bassiana ARSEF 2860]